MYVYEGLLVQSASVFYLLLFLCVCMCVCLCVYFCVCSSVRLTVCLCICLSANWSLCLSVSVCLSVFFVCLLLSVRLCFTTSDDILSQPGAVAEEGGTGVLCLCSVGVETIRRARMSSGPEFMVPTRTETGVAPDL